ncbi:MAG: ribosome small subunit-dependent GTPase A [Clostridiales bacterium]|nr:ribosome small subunit-dependent GTPase A [Clostridiales bacterium]
MSDIKIGRIIKGIGGFYSVESHGVIYTCKARGKFRKDELTPTVGDMVEFTPPHETHEGVLKKLLDRKNLMIRPRVANIDLIIIVIAAMDPPPDYTLVDKMLINAEMMHTDAIICINKHDLTGKKVAEKIANQYLDIDTLIVSAHKNSGIKQLKKYCQDKTICFGGQSGTGKSSLLNVIMPDSTIEVGEVSKKTKRGKHTTRHAELIPFNGGYLVDTPGFSLLELPMMEPNELQDYYKDFAEFEGGCKYKTCRHDSEPGCLVLEAVNENKISKERHERYRTLLKEAEEKWRSRYD